MRPSLDGRGEGGRCCCSWDCSRSPEQPPTATTADTAPPDVPGWPGFDFLAAQQVEGLGLLESFVDHEGLPPDFRSWLAASRPAFVYDSALAAIAWLARDAPGDRERAAAVLDGLLAVQLPDGTVHSPVDVTTGAGPVDAGTGNLSWCMLAWLAGYEVTGDVAWRDAAERTARFLVRAEQQSAVDFGGFTLSPGVTALSTEGNLDAYAAFTRLGEVLDDDGLRDAGTRARLFVESRFDPQTAAVFPGTLDGGRLSRRTPLPLDTHAWSVLALGREKWRESLQLAWQDAPVGLMTQASSQCGGVRGPGFSTADTGDVWVEGLAQLTAAAILLGESAIVAELLPALDAIRTGPAHGDGRGLVAACGALDTGFGSQYFDALHVGATAWAALAVERVDPFWFRSLDEGLATHPAADLPTVRLDAPPGAVYPCEGAAPCRFTVTGTLAPAAAAVSVHLLVEPLVPDPFGTWFAQAVPAIVGPDGRFTVDGQLGSEAYPASPGDAMRLAVIAVDPTAPPTGPLQQITPATLPGIVTTSGVLRATVE